MKKLLYALLGIILIGTLILTGCGEQAVTTTAPAATTTVKTTTPAGTTGPAATKTTAVVPTTAAPGTPKVGGTIVQLHNQGPKVLGYPPEMSSNDYYSCNYFNETLFVMSNTGAYEGVLCESWKLDKNASTLTYNLRKGVKFHDGTVMDAAAVKWNIEQMIAAKVAYYPYITSMDIVDANTLRLNLSYIDLNTVTNYSSMYVVSPTAFKNAGADDEARKSWSRLNPVGTGPYKLVEFKRDAYLKMTRNNDYWRAGKPYIQNIEYKIIPDVSVCSALMQSGDGDVWTSNLINVPTAITLEKKGFQVTYGAISMTPCLFFNSDDPTKPWADQKIRAAVEYAINRPQLAALIGSGKYTPLTQMSQPGSYSWNDDYDPRPFNVQKAKDLLKEAGYPNGYKTKIMTIARDKDIAAAIQGYLKEVGIDATLDVADPGRYYTIWPQGWDELLVAMMPTSRNSSEIVFQYGPQPINFKKSIKKSPEFIAMANEALKASSYEDIKDLMKKMVRQFSDECMVVPLFASPYILISRNDFHTAYLGPVDGTLWRHYDDWTDDLN